MCQSAKHDMAEMICLFLDGSRQFRVFIAMDHTPPGRYRIDQFLIFRIKINTLGI